MGGGGEKSWSDTRAEGTNPGLAPAHGGRNGRGEFWVGDSVKGWNKPCAVLFFGGGAGEKWQGRPAKRTGQRNESFRRRDSKIGGGEGGDGDGGSGGEEAGKAKLRNHGPQEPSEKNRLDERHHHGEGTIEEKNNKRGKGRI